MTDHLDRLIDRSFNGNSVLQPLPISRFAAPATESQRQDSLTDPEIESSAAYDRVPPVPSDRALLRSEPPKRDGSSWLADRVQELSYDVADLLRSRSSPNSLPETLEERQRPTVESVREPSIQRSDRTEAVRGEIRPAIGNVGREAPPPIQISPKLVPVVDPAPDPQRDSPNILAERLTGTADLPKQTPVPRIVPETVPQRSVQPSPTINVTIGRVEVKAGREPSPKSQVRAPRRPSSAMSLEDYLRRRASGGAR